MSNAPAERPSLGTMLRLIHAALVQEYSRWLAGTDHEQIRPAHAAILQPLWAAKDGERLTALAANASITKQSAGALVEQLLAAGYVERVPDPDDGRAMRIRLTARGRRYGRDVRRFAREFEARVEAGLGAGKTRQFRDTLDSLWQLLNEGEG